MKQKLLFTIIVGLSLFFGACKKYLQEQLVSGVSYDFYNTEDGIEAALNSCYSELRYPWGNEYAFTFAEYGTDTYTEGSDGSNKSSFNEYGSALNSTHSYLPAVWDSYYRGINIANICVKRIPAINGVKIYTNSTIRNNRLAEARFLRAYYYYMLAQTFGNVPLNLEENLAVKTEFKRAPVADVYRQIIADLRYSVDSLPLTQTDYGRATKGAAQHLLSRIYLTRASTVTDQRGQQPTDADSAAYYAEQVIQSGQYKLLPDYAQVYQYGNEKNSEIIFAIQFTKNPLYNGDGNRTDHFFLMEYDVLAGMQRSVDNGKPFKRLRPTDFMLDVYDRKNDSRFYKSFKMTYFSNNASTIPKWDAGNAPNPSLVGKPKYQLGDTAVYLTLQKGVPADSIARKPYMWVTRDKYTSRLYPSLNKYIDPGRPDKNSDVGTRDFVLMRLSETYLIAAEAYGRKGDFVKAAQYINIVRQRAAYKEGEVKPKEFYKVEGGNVADLTKSTEAAMLVTPATLSSGSFVDFILDERARELSGEHLRWYDLVRTEKLVERVKKYNKEAANIRDFHKLRPIPQTHIDRLTNPGPISEEQNAGYY